MSNLNDAGRQLNAMRAGLVRVHKTLGLVAVIAILVGLTSFLLVNVFYFFDRSWIRPEILSPTHDRVLDNRARIAAERAHLHALTVARDKLQIEHRSLARMIEANLRFEGEFTALHEDRDDAATHAAVLAWREYDRAVLERARAVERREAIPQEIAALDAEIARSERLITRLERSPIGVAGERAVTVAFVPHDHLANVSPGQPIYGCELGLVWCTKVGKVGAPIDGEVTSAHPHSGDVLRGLMFEIHVSQASATAETLFVGRRPLWVL